MSSLVYVRALVTLQNGGVLSVLGKRAWGNRHVAVGYDLSILISNPDFIGVGIRKTGG